MSVRASSSLEDTHHLSRSLSSSRMVLQPSRAKRRRSSPRPRPSFSALSDLDTSRFIPERQRVALHTTQQTGAMADRTQPQLWLRDSGRVRPEREIVWLAL